MALRSIGLTAPDPGLRRGYRPFGEGRRQLKPSGRQQPQMTPSLLFGNPARGFAILCSANVAADLSCNRSLG